MAFGLGFVSVTVATVMVPVLIPSVADGGFSDVIVTVGVTRSSSRSRASRQGNRTLAALAFGLRRWDDENLRDRNWGNVGKNMDPRTSFSCSGESRPVRN